VTPAGGASNGIPAGGGVNAALGRLRENARPARRPVCDYVRWTRTGGGRRNARSLASSQEARSELGVGAIRLYAKAVGGSP
jgi:hypothetical protein